MCNITLSYSINYMFFSLYIRVIHTYKTSNLLCRHSCYFMFQRKIVIAGIVKSFRTIKFFEIAVTLKETVKERPWKAMKEVRDFVEKRFLAHPLREIEGRSCDKIVSEGS